MTSCRWALSTAPTTDYDCVGVGGCLRGTACAASATACDRVGEGLPGKDGMCSLGHRLLVMMTVCV